MGFKASLIQSPKRFIDKAKTTRKIAGKNVIHHSPENKKLLPNLISVPKDGVVGGTPTPRKLNVDSVIIAKAKPIVAITKMGLNTVSYTHLTLPTKRIV